jgi:hypothetical protein
MTLTDKERKQLQHELYMDDCKPHLIMALSDEELLRIVEKNRAFHNPSPLPDEYWHSMNKD